MKIEGYSPSQGKSETTAYLPDFSADHIEDVDFAFLHENLGVRHVLLDLDLTIRRRHADELEAQTITALAAIRPTYGFETLNLVTTNTHNLHRFSEPIGANVFQPFRHHGRIIRKPQPAFFAHVLEKLHARPEESIMIDDRLRIIRGANRLGMYTLLMQPLGHDYLTDRLRLTRFRDQRRLRAARAALALTREVHKDVGR